jgi:hypothetical protein
MSVLRLSCVDSIVNSRPPKRDRADDWPPASTSSSSSEPLLLHSALSPRRRSSPPVSSAAKMSFTLPYVSLLSTFSCTVSMTRYVRRLS